MTRTAKKASPTSSSVVIPKTDCILALDMSLGHTGYALVKRATGEVIKGVIEPAGLKGMPRLAYLREQVLHLAMTGFRIPAMDRPMCVPWVSCLVLIEGYAYGAKGQAVISLGELGGVIRLALHDEDIPYLEIPPAQLKRFVTGKGNAPKQVMLMEVFDRWGEKHYDDNIADAFALMQLGLAVAGLPTKPLLKFQSGVVADVTKSYLAQHSSATEGAAA